MYQDKVRGSEEVPTLRAIRPNHYVYATDEELQEFELKLQKMEAEKEQMDQKIRELVDGE